MKVELLKKHSEHDEQVVLEKLPKLKKRAPAKYAGIRCPKCQWRPRSSSRWFCSRPVPGKHLCSHSWNTFDTHGKCPACNYQWLDTACLNCSKWSRHEDWYEQPPGNQRE